MGYEVRLSQFRGPLELLLHLIEKAEVDIKDIFVSEITAQYLEYMQEIDTLDMDTASEFIDMASTLVYIKSRSLLPRPPREESGGEDPAEALIRRLREYRAAREAGEKLGELLEKAGGMYPKLPEEFILPPREINFEESSAQSLLAAFTRLLERRRMARGEAAGPQEVHSDVYTVRRQAAAIREILKKKRTAAFEELFPEDAPKLEIIVTFMALLDMIFGGEVRVEQSGPYRPIFITARELRRRGAGAEYEDGPQGR